MGVCKQRVCPLQSNVVMTVFQALHIILVLFVSCKLVASLPEGRQVDKEVLNIHVQ